MIIEQPAVYLRWLYPKALWRMDRRERAVYLTFDDGPIPESTPFILDILRRFGVRATFFVVGDNVRKYPDLFQQIIDEGHLVGNHTHNHISGFRHTVRDYMFNVEKANAYIRSHFFRPPHGWMRLSQYAWLSRRYKVVMWDVVTRDYSKWMTPDDIVNNVKRYVRNGSIITFHDSLKAIDKLHTALPQSLQWLTEQGYAFKVF
ncbi:MAG: polysaccharide deacetylase family protein [Prevotella sp.]|nr:polysaccharide deacetylase family protein [Prevotella sp.]